MDKVVASLVEAVDGIESGSTVAVGGFGVCGVPIALIGAILETDIDELEVISNNCGLDGWGLGLLLAERRIRRVICSFIGENREFGRQFLAGEIEVELTPQGTLAERLRAGGCGIPAFYTVAGVGTLVADGGLPWRYASDGSIAVSSPKKETRKFRDVDYILEESIVADVALVRAAIADRLGNVIFHESARNFNPICAMSGKLTIVEAEQIVEVGAISPDAVHLPGVFVNRVVQAPLVAEKLIEKHTVRKREEVGS